MKFFIAGFVVLFVFATSGFSQTQDEEMTAIYRQDFKRVNVVASIRVEKVEMEFEWGKPKTGGGYTMYRLIGKIVESFKGAVKNGKPILFYSFREGQPPTADLKRNYIRFLKVSRNDKGQKVLVELENSGAAINETNLLMFRKLR